MKKTFITSVVAVLCTLAICITYAVKAPKADVSAAASSADSSNYMTEAEAAKYIGVTDEVMQMMRENLKYFEGAYMSYAYTDGDGKEVNDVIYNKSALDDVVKKLMSSDSHALNFKYIQESLKNSK